MTLPELSAAELAVRFHETYERLAPSFGYETRTETRAFDPDSPNGRLMIAVCGELLRTGQLVERDAVAGVVEALHLIQSFGCPVCSGDCSSANPPVMACPMKALSAALTAIKGGGDAERMMP